MRRDPNTRVYAPKAILRELDYKTETERAQLVQSIHDNHRLDRFSESLLLNTRFEYIVTLPLMEKGVPTLYEPFSFPICWEITSTPNYCLPDFLLPYHCKDGRPIIIEPHSLYVCSSKKEVMADLKKFDALRRSYGLYVVLIHSQKLGFPAIIDTDLVKQHVDEFWCDNYSGPKGMRTMRAHVKEFLATTEVRPVSAVGPLLDQLRRTTN